MAKQEGHQEAFVCGEEAEALLNCIAAKNYNELKCIPLVKKLRACIEKAVRRKTCVVHMFQSLVS